MYRSIADLWCGHSRQKWAVHVFAGADFRELEGAKVNPRTSDRVTDAFSPDDNKSSQPDLIITVLDVIRALKLTGRLTEKVAETSRSLPGQQNME
ncbi:unnamed protein product [Protopolystoma xenopodis]|uniref:Uncharacterized protein n=1 Tax=Protopolystoma xenopodis TaxID=117903 RepID=A0A448XB39_9PLAT|nr:unnamed protein product [Protopolystoma xenopodis]